MSPPAQRRVPIEELLEACRQIDPKTDNLSGEVKALEEKGFTMATALVKIANDQSALRKPATSAPVPPKPGLATGT
jgi:hypothetical protein